MSHGRHDYPKAIHLVRVQGRPGYAIFFPSEILREHLSDSRELAPDLKFWESLVARACDRHAARIHGYTWLPNEAILLLQRFAVPLRIILPSLLGRYSRYLHETARVPPGESPYLCRCESLEVTPELLPYALRNLYARAVRAGLCESPLKYPLCSSSLHFAESVPPWFENQEFIARVRRRGHIGRPSVEQFLAKPESQRHAGLFGRFSSRTPQIAGESADIEDSIRLARHCPLAPSVEQVAEAVATILRREARPLDGVLAAALITWYATRSGAATLAEMGQRFGREPTTLRANIESHRKTSAALFELSIGDFLRLSRSQTTARTTFRVISRRDVDGVAKVPSPASNARVSETPFGGLGPKTPPYGVPVLRNAPRQRRGGPSCPAVFSGFATCMISKEDTACYGAQSEAELSCPRRRRTQKQP